MYLRMTKCFFEDDLHLEPCCQYAFYRMKQFLPGDKVALFMNWTVSTCATFEMFPGGGYWGGGQLRAGRLQQSSQVHLGVVWGAEQVEAGQGGHLLGVEHGMPAALGRDTADDWCALAPPPAPQPHGACAQLARHARAHVPEYRTWMYSRVTSCHYCKVHSEQSYKLSGHQRCLSPRHSTKALAPFKLRTFQNSPKLTIAPFASFVETFCLKAARKPLNLRTAANRLLPTSPSEAGSWKIHRLAANWWINNQLRSQ